MDTTNKINQSLQQQSSQIPKDSHHEISTRDTSSRQPQILSVQGHNNFQHIKQQNQDSMQSYSVQHSKKGVCRQQVQSAKQSSNVQNKKKMIKIQSAKNSSHKKLQQQMQIDSLNLPLSKQQHQQLLQETSYATCTTQYKSPQNSRSQQNQNFIYLNSNDLNQYISSQTNNQMQPHNLANINKCVLSSEECSPSQFIDQQQQSQKYNVNTNNRNFDTANTPVEQAQYIYANDVQKKRNFFKSFKINKKIKNYSKQSDIGFQSQQQNQNFSSTRDENNKSCNNNSGFKSPDNNVQQNFSDCQQFFQQQQQKPVLLNRQQSQPLMNKRSCSHRDQKNIQNMSQRQHFKEIIQHFLKKRESISLYEQHDEIVQNIKDIPELVKTSIDSTFFIAENQLIKNNNSSQQFSKYKMNKKKTQQDSSQQSLSQTQQQFETNSSNITNNQNIKSSSNQKQIQNIIFELFQMLENLDTKYIKPHMKDYKQEHYSFLGKDHKQSIGNILEDINAYIPSVIKNCLKINKELGVACEGVYKFLLFFFNQVSREIKQNVEKQVKNKCQDKQLLISNLENQLEDVQKSERKLIQKLKLFEQDSQQERIKSKERENFLLHEIAMLRQKIEDNLNQEIIEPRIKEQYKEFQIVTRQFDKDIQIRQEEAEYQVKLIGEVLVNWKKSYGSKIDTFQNQYDLGGVKDIQLSNLQGKHPFIPILLHYEIVKLGIDFKKSPVYQKIRDNPLHTTHIMEKFYYSYYTPDKIQLHNPAEGLIMYLLKENNQNMSLVSYIIQQIVQKLYMSLRLQQQQQDQYSDYVSSNESKQQMDTNKSNTSLESGQINNNISYENQILSFFCKVFSIGEKNKNFPSYQILLDLYQFRHEISILMAQERSVEKEIEKQKQKKYGQPQPIQQFQVNIDTLQYNEDIEQFKRQFKLQILSLQNTKKEEFKFYFKENYMENHQHPVPSSHHLYDPPASSNNLQQQPQQQNLPRNSNYLTPKTNQTAMNLNIPIQNLNSINISIPKEDQLNSNRLNTHRSSNLSTSISQNTNLVNLDVLIDSQIIQILLSNNMQTQKRHRSSIYNSSMRGSISNRSHFFDQPYVLKSVRGETPLCTVFENYIDQKNEEDLKEFQTNLNNFQVQQQILHKKSDNSQQKFRNNKDLVLNYKNIRDLASKHHINPLHLHKFIMIKYYDHVETEKRLSKEPKKFDNPLTQFLVTKNDPIFNIIQNCVESMSNVNKIRLRTENNFISYSYQNSVLQNIIEEVKNQAYRNAKAEVEMKSQKEIEEISLQIQGKSSGRNKSKRPGSSKKKQKN